jgi:hypothetical protein
MLNPILSCVEEVATSLESRPNAGALTIRCYVYASLTPSPRRFVLRGDRELAAQAMTLLMRIDGKLKYARADWNEDRFRRLMRLRSKAVTRLRRRWERLNPKPRIPLGTLRRRYHASLSGYLYQAKE